jgi:hypothetical protein
VIDFRVIGIGQIDPGAALDPLVLVVVVVRHPVEQALVLDEAVQARLPVVTQVGAGNVDLRAPARKNPDLVAVRLQAFDGDIIASVHKHGQARERIGVGARRRAAQRHSGEVDGDVGSADGEGGVLKVRRLEIVGSRRHPRCPGNHSAGHGPGLSARSESNGPALSERRRWDDENGEKDRDRKATHRSH